MCDEDDEIPEPLPDDYPFGFAFFEPKPNEIFDERMHELTRFVVYRKPVACAHCGKERIDHWTLYDFFQVMDWGEFVLLPSEKEYPPLTPVCGDHILAPTPLKQEVEPAPSGNQ